MCGIFGYFDRTGNELDAKTLVSMGEAIRHRGPDDSGIFRAKGAAIGNQRLSIIDIAGGHQPIISDDGMIAVVQNGEIYNYIELAQDLAKTGHACRTDSDTEVILRLYERDGEEFVSKLNGMFAIAIYDARSGSLLLYRDRVGVKPLYFHDDGKRMIFASEIKSILNAGVSSVADDIAIHHYLTFNYVPPPYTIFKGISHLMPGHWMKISAQGSGGGKWWGITGQTESIPEADWVERFNWILDDAVRIRMRADVPFGAFLSGGIDSSSVVAYMSRRSSMPIKTFCIGFNDERFDESMHALQAATMFSTEHVMEKVDSDLTGLWPLAILHCDQPHGDVSFLPTYRVSQLAVKHVKMVLTGDGGDELFAGYEKYLDFFSKGRGYASNADFQRAYFNSISLMDEKSKKELYTPSFAALAGSVDSFGAAEKFFREADGMDRINQALYVDTMLLLPGNNLVKPDRMGMAVSLEARTPFLDYRMVELAFRTPGSLKLKDGQTKYIYKKAVRHLIGDELVYRKKQMFTVPIGEWFKGRLRVFMESVLLSGRFLERGIFEREPIKKLISSHLSGKKNCTRELRALIALELWFRVVLEKDFDGTASLLSSAGKTFQTL